MFCAHWALVATQQCCPHRFLGQSSRSVSSAFRSNHRIFSRPSANESHWVMYRAAYAQTKMGVDVHRLELSGHHVSFSASSIPPEKFVPPSLSHAVVATAGARWTAIEKGVPHSFLLVKFLLLAIAGSGVASSLLAVRARHLGAPSSASWILFNRTSGWSMKRT